MAARLHDGAWWEMDTWHPRCDPRIPLRDREPCRSVGCSPGEAQLPWVKNAVKWHLGMLLESGTLTWSTLTGQRSQALLRFTRWLESLPDPAAAVGDVQRAGTFAAAFRRWACEPSNRTSAGRPPAAVSAGKVNLDLWSVAGLMDFLAGHRQEAAEILGPSPWDGLTDAHPAIWLRQHARAARPGRPAADADAPAADPHRPPRQRDLPVSLRLPVPGHGQRHRGRGRGRRRPLPLRPEQDRRRARHHLRRRRDRRGDRGTAAVAARPLPGP